MLKFITFSKLIEKVTSTDDSVSINTFLITYRSYCTPLELINALIQRYTKTNSDETIVRIKIFNVIRHWIVTLPYDFYFDDYLREQMFAFLSSIEKPEEKKIAMDIIVKLEKDPSIHHPINYSSPPEPVLPVDTNIDIIYFPTIEIARQLTILEWNRWGAINPWEFLDLSWTKKNKNEAAPNIIAASDHFNNISDWVATKICFTENFRERVKILKRFIDIAVHFKSMANFNGLMEIWSGLRRGPVYRLKQTYKALSKKYYLKLSEIEQICKTTNYKHIRESIKSADPPLIPYLGMYLTDMTFIEEGNKSFVTINIDDKVIPMINFGKCRLVSELLSKIQLYQNKSYNFAVSKIMQEKLKNLRTVDEKLLYSLSEFYEPRINQPPVERPAILDTLGPKIVHMPQVVFRLEVNLDWPFGQPDSPSNLNYDLNTQEVVSASLVKIIERLSHHQNPDRDSIIPFLSTHRTFTSCDKLLNLLIQRYKVPNPQDKSPEQMTKYKILMKGPISVHVTDILKNWIKWFWSDFKESLDLMNILNGFIADLSSTEDDKKSANLLNILIGKVF